MKKIILAVLISLITISAFADSSVEIPLLKYESMNYNDINESNKPDIMMRQLEYISAATPKELLAFYEKSEYTKQCKYNESADNYLCYLAEVGKVKDMGHPKKYPKKILRYMR